MRGVRIAAGWCAWGHHLYPLGKLHVALSAHVPPKSDVEGPSQSSMPVFSRPAAITSIAATAGPAAGVAMPGARQRAHLEQRQQQHGAEQHTGGGQHSHAAPGAQRDAVRPVQRRIPAAQPAGPGSDMQCSGCMGGRAGSCSCTGGSIRTAGACIDMLDVTPAGGSSERAVGAGQLRCAGRGWLWLLLLPLPLQMALQLPVQWVTLAQRSSEAAALAESA
jgi:hypothetical protein